MYQVNLSPRTIALIESFRLDETESVDAILMRKLAAEASIKVTPPTRKFALGKGVWLSEGEQVYFFRRSASLKHGLPEAVALISDGKFMLYGKAVQKSHGSYVQPALKMVQKMHNDTNTSGAFISLDAWLLWYVERDGKLVSVGSLRDPEQVAKRKAYSDTDITLHEPEY